MNAFRAWFFLTLMLTTFFLATPGMAAPSIANGTPNAADNVQIINTGDAYLPGYRITVGPTGQLRARSFPRNGSVPIRRRNQMLPANYQRFLNSLTKAAPINKLPTGTATRRGQRRRGGQPAKTPVDFPQILVVYKGQQSPNLRAVTSTNGKLLYQEVKQIMHDLGMPIPNVP